jgi:hypothetical protein
MGSVRKENSVHRSPIFVIKSEQSRRDVKEEKDKGKDELQRTGAAGMP